MPKRATKPVISQIAHQIVVAATNPPPTSPTHMAINLASAALGRVGSLRAVPAGATNLKSKERSRTTSKAGQGRRTKKSTRAK
jgi:hypothetical protein